MVGATLHGKPVEPLELYTPVCQVDTRRFYLLFEVVQPIFAYLPRIYLRAVRRTGHPSLYSFFPEWTIVRKARTAIFSGYLDLKTREKDLLFRVIFSPILVSFAPPAREPHRSLEGFFLQIFNRQQEGRLHTFFPDDFFPCVLLPPASHEHYGALRPSRYIRTACCSEIPEPFYVFPYVPKAPRARRRFYVVGEIVLKWQIFPPGCCDSSPPGGKPGEPRERHPATKAMKIDFNLFHCSVSMPLLIPRSSTPIIAHAGRPSLGNSRRETPSACLLHRSRCHKTDRPRNSPHAQNHL